MPKAGRVLIGFSKPYVAVYAGTNATVSYSKGQVLARGVSVSVKPTTSDSNKFYADNGDAENGGGEFTGGTMTLTVDGLLDTASTLIYGLPAADTATWIHYGDEMVIPYVGVGYIEKYMSDHVISYVPKLIRKSKFNVPEDSATTQEDTISFQTQELSASVFRDDAANHDWKWEGAEQTTESAAENLIKAALGITA
jgi:phi13 family phage major tail protein